jgi:hypothetical protein
VNRKWLMVNSTAKYLLEPASNYRSLLTIC